MRPVVPLVAEDGADVSNMFKFVSYSWQTPLPKMRNRQINPSLIVTVAQSRRGGSFLKSTKQFREILHDFGTP